MHSMKTAILRNKTVGKHTKQLSKGTTLSFGRSILAAAVARLVRDRTLDPKVQGSNPGTAEAFHLYKHDLDRPPG